jgi:hypothetical protein
MNNEEKIDALFENQGKIKIVLERIIKHLENRTETEMDIWKKNIELWNGNEKRWKSTYIFLDKFYSLFFYIIFVLVSLIFRNEITATLVSLVNGLINGWAALSENWQIAIFGFGGSLFIAIFAIFIDRKFFRSKK